MLPRQSSEDVPNQRVKEPSTNWDPTPMNSRVHPVTEADLKRDTRDTHKTDGNTGPRRGFDSPMPDAASSANPRSVHTARVSSVVIGAKSAASARTGDRLQAVGAHTEDSRSKSTAASSLPEETPSPYKNKTLAAIDIYFGVTRKRSTIKMEVLGGLTLFVVTAYIMNVHPLFEAGIINQSPNPLAAHLQSLTRSTALVTGVFTILIGIIGNASLVIAPGLGYNAIFADLIADHKASLDWEDALGLVFISGVFYFIVAAVVFGSARIGKTFMMLVPVPLRIGTSVGIGLLLAFVGLSKTTGMGMFSVSASGLEFPKAVRYELYLGLGGITLLVALFRRGFRSAAVVTVVTVTVLSVIIRAAKVETLLESGAFTNYKDMGSIIGKLSFGKAAESYAPSFIVTLVATKLLDSLCTILAYGQLASCATRRAERVYNERQFRKVMSQSLSIRRLFLVDATLNVITPLFGLTSTTIFIESVCALWVGCRTGLASVVTGAMFLLCFFVQPVVALIPGEATGTVLLLVAVTITGLLRFVKFGNVVSAVPAVAAMLFIPLTSNIALGVSFTIVLSVFVWIESGDIASVVLPKDLNTGVPTAVPVAFALLLLATATLNILAAMGVF